MPTAELYTKVRVIDTRKNPLSTSTRAPTQPPEATKVLNFQFNDSNNSGTNYRGGPKGNEKSWKGCGKGGNDGDVEDNMERATVITTMLESMKAEKKERLGFRC